MKSISIEEAAHKNVILWHLAQKLELWQVKKAYDINRKAIVMSLGRPVDKGSSSCRRLSFDRLKCIDSRGNAHVYAFTDQSSWIWQVRSVFSLFSTAVSKTVVYARAELLDHLVEDFTFGLKWKKEKLLTKPDEISQACIDIDLNFGGRDADIEKSIIEFACAL